MARYIRDEVLNQPEDFVNFMVSDFLTKHGFVYTKFKGQMLYRSGKGILELPKFLIWNYQNGVFHLETWTRNAWLPGVYGRENAMTGFMGCIPKSSYKGDVDRFLALLHQPVMQQQGGGQPAAGSVPQQAQGPVMVHGVDNVGDANLTLCFGIIGLVFFCVPWVSLLMGIMAVVYWNKSKNSSRAGRANAGLVLGILAIIFSSVLLILYFTGVLSGVVFG